MYNPTIYTQSNEKVLISHEPLSQVHVSTRWSRGVSNALNLINQRPSNHHAVCVFTLGVQVRCLLRRRSAGDCVSLQSSTCDVQRLKYDEGRPPEKFELFLQNTFKVIKDFKNPPPKPSLVCVTQVYHKCFHLFSGSRNLLADLCRSVGTDPN